MRTLVVAPLLLVALIWLAAPGLAQSKKEKDAEANLRSVQGQVTSPEGDAVAGAVVHLKNTKTLQVRSFITKTDGTYSFQGLSTNVDYELKAENQGASSDSRTLSSFDSRNQAVINLKLNKK
jgi:hypothetical protein